MKRKILLLVGVVATQLLIGQTIFNFTTDTTTMIANPERGFQGKLYPVWAEPTPTITRALKQSDCDRVKAKLYTVIGIRYVLYPWRTTDLSTEILAQIKADCDLIRANGLKLNVDFAYNYAYGYYDNVKKLSDAPESWVLRHIDQLTTNGGANDGPLLVCNDVIAYWNVGFIGSWGEEHHSSNNLLYDPRPDVYATMNDATNNIWSALLTKIPGNRMISTRYCAFKKQYAKNVLMTDTTTGNMARIGIHDYSFACNVDNMGSFQFYAGGGMARVNALRKYCANECKYTVSSGEPYGSDPTFKKQQYADSVIAEMRFFDLDFYNGEFDEVAAHAVTYNKWQMQGKLTKMKNFIGYRLHVNTSTIPSKMNPGVMDTLRINIENRGWGKIFNPRPVNLLLCRKNGDTYAEKYVVSTSLNPRKWLAESQHNESIPFTIPIDAPDGTYDLLLQLPDEYASLASNPAYSVRFVNKYNNSDTWNPTLGANWIGSTIVGEVAVNEFKKSDFKIFPNPICVSNTLKIETDADFESQMAICDLQSRTVFKTSFQNQLQLPLYSAKIKAGFYILKMLTDNKMSSQLLVVQ